MPSSTEHTITLPLLIRFLAALSAHKLPTQAQFSTILQALLNSPIFDSAGHPERQPDLIRSLARLLVLLRKVTDLNNKENQCQRLIYALVTQEPQITMPSAPALSTLSTTSPITLLKMVLMNSLDIPKDTFQIVDKAIQLLKDFFQNPKFEFDDQALQTCREITDRLVTELVKFLVKLHQHFGNLLKNKVDSIYQALSHDLETFQLNEDAWEMINLFGECVSGFLGAGAYWDSLTTPCHELGELFTQNKQELLKPLKKLQVVILDLFGNFEEQLYSPKLYDNLRLILEELKTSSGLIAKPMKEILGTLEAMRLRAMEDDQLWRELVEVVQQVSADFVESINLDLSPRKAAGSVAKAAFRTMIEYLVPRLLLLMNEIPSPRIEFVSPTIDAVFDPASFTSASGFLPTTIFSTTVLRLEITNQSPHDAIGVASMGCLNPSHQLVVNPTTKQRISISGLRVMSKNVGFYFHKKVNQDKNLISRSLDFTNFEDEGKLDVFLGMGNEDGLNLDFELDWNPYHCHRLGRKTGGLSDRDHGGNLNGNKPAGLFTIENFKVDLKGFGIFPHNTNHPILNWFLKPGLEPYLHAKLIHVLQQYLLDQLSRLNCLLGKMRVRWEEAVDSGLGSWETFIEVIKLLNSNSDDHHEREEPTSNSQIDGVGLTIKAEDDSYVIRIGIGQKMLPGKGIGGPGQFQERLGTMRNEVVAAIDSRVTEIATGIAQATIDADRPGWESNLFDLCP